MLAQVSRLIVNLGIAAALVFGALQATLDDSWGGDDPQGRGAFGGSRPGRRAAGRRRAAKTACVPGDRRKGAPDGAERSARQNGGPKSRTRTLAKLGKGRG